jgi:hypothetical protein
MTGVSLPLCKQDARLFTKVDHANRRASYHRQAEKGDGLVLLHLVLLAIAYGQGFETVAFRASFYRRSRIKSWSETHVESDPGVCN